MSASLKKKELDNLPINKYSSYEIKSSIGDMITKYLEENKFKEHQRYSNLKIITGMIVLSFTTLAYFYPKPFPLNYMAIVIGVVGYCIFSIIYWYIDSYIIKDIFYCGQNQDYCEKYRHGKHCKIFEIILYGKVPDYTAEFQYKMKFITDDGIFYSNEYTIMANTVIDERGYPIKNLIEKYFVENFHKELKKIK